MLLPADIIEKWELIIDKTDLSGDIMKGNLIQKKSYAFALRIVKLCHYLTEEKKEFVLSREVLRSGTSIGSYVEESTQAESTTDFIHKLSHANKESFKTNYRLRLLRDSEYLTDKQAKSLIDDCEEMQRLLISSIKTSKGKLEPSDS